MEGQGADGGGEGHQEPQQPPEAPGKEGGDGGQRQVEPEQARPPPAVTDTVGGMGGSPHPLQSPPIPCEGMGGRELLRRPRTTHDSHTIVASTRVRSRSTNLAIDGFMRNY